MREFQKRSNVSEKSETFSDDKVRYHFDKLVGATGTLENMEKVELLSESDSSDDGENEILIRKIAFCLAVTGLAAEIKFETILVDELSAGDAIWPAYLQVAKEKNSN